MLDPNSPQAQLITGALCENLHRIYFHSPVGMTPDRCDAVARDAIENATRQVGMEPVEDALAGLHVQLRAKVAALKV